MTPRHEYQFPEKVPFRAMEVTKPEFMIQSRADWMEKLWVDFSQVRDASQFDRLDFSLGITEGKLAYSPEDYRKVIFSGHRGCGKSVELLRYKDRINQPDAFFTIFIDLEKETSIERFQPEDLFVALITILLRELGARGVNFDKKDFELIAKDWISETELVNEMEKSFGLAAEASVSLGWKFWEFLGIGANLKGTYSADNKTTKTVRQQIRTNPQTLITALNAALVAVRQNIISAGLGRDLIFVVDGLEKTNHEVYESLFIKDSQLILGLGAHLLLTVPIGTFYEVQSQNSRDFFGSFYLPMMRLNEHTIPLLKDMVTRRVDAALLELGVLDKLISMSGGCPRQLLKLVNRCFLLALGKSITLEHAVKAIREEGNERWRTLTSDHQAILQARKFESANMEVLQLLESLNILEYNGNNLERRINPLIEHFFPPNI